MKQAVNLDAVCQQERVLLLQLKHISTITLTFAEMQMHTLYLSLHSFGR